MFLLKDYKIRLQTHDFLQSGFFNRQRKLYFFSMLPDVGTVMLNRSSPHYLVQMLAIHVPLALPRRLGLSSKCCDGQLLWPEPQLALGWSR